jgi:hypothetical protein
MNYIYEVETDIDFFKELKKITADKMDQLSTAGSMSNVKSESDTDVRCLITDEKLRKDHITLKCGHKFNYVPLFKEVLYQKCSLLPKNISSKLVTTYTKNLPATSATSQAPPSSTGTSSTSSSNSNVLSITYNSSYNLETTKLQYNEMKCPYCRTITPYILPFYPYQDVCRVKYVNTPPNLSLPALACEYDKFISAGENTICTTSETTGCRTHSIYYDKYDLMLCNKHFNKIEAGTTMSSKTRKKSLSANNSANSADTSDMQNIIISHHNPATTACSFALLSGPRKGCPCGNPMWIPKTSTCTSTSTSTSTIHDAGLPAYCKAHYNKGMQLH